MKKLFTVITILIISVCSVKAQQYGLFNTGTLFDAFENPAQKHFTLDSSRIMSSNFFLPYFGINANHKGGTDDILRKMLNEGIYDTRSLALGTGNLNKLNLNTNIYLFAFKFYKSYKYNQEIGVSWQIRTDAHINYTNETLALFDSFRRFTDPSYIDVFNTMGYEQTYHQMSITYREDIDKRLSFGGKLSLLNGIAFNRVNVTSSSLVRNDLADQLNIGLTGTYRGNFVYLDSLSKKDVLPFLKNPGISITAGFKYKSKSGYTIIGNIKDLGVIKWNNKSYNTNVNAHLTFNDLANSNTNARISNAILDVINNSNQRAGFYTATNAKADIYASKTFGVYTPAIIASKNLFYPGGDIAMVNTIKAGNISGSVIPAYNLSKIFMVGLQAMYKTPNFEVFMGSDNISKTFSTIGGITSQDATTGKGYNAASFYMGLGFKIGRVVQHPMNSDYMPGVGVDEQQKNFLQRLWSNFKKKSK